MLGLVLFIVFAVASLALGFVVTKTSYGVIKSPQAKIDYKTILKKEGILTLIFGFTFTMMLVSIYWWRNISPKAGEVVCTIIGGYIFAVLGLVSLNTFILHYYGNNVPENLNKWLFRTLCVAFPLMFVFIFLCTDGFAGYLTYPLYNGISFKEGLVRPNEDASIAFYAMCILSGAIYVYFLCDHKLYLEYGKHGLLESTFLVALPAGIIGARIFYVIGELDQFVIPGDPWNSFLAMINIREGGLTIMGGAPTGIVVGASWFMWRHKGKGYNILRVVDIIIPSILIAQAVGRWGNFFNLEVYGNLVDEKYFAWLPKVIFNNMHYNGNGVLVEQGKILVPLFLIEGIVNFLGFFFLAHFCEHTLKKYRKDLDICIGYIVWYGLTRVVMEPLRDPTYNMGEKGAWSSIWAYIFVAVGILAIVLNHVIRYLIAKNKTKNQVVAEQPKEETKEENE